MIVRRCGLANSPTRRTVVQMEEMHIGASGEGEVERVRVGPAVDPRRAVRTSPAVPEVELLEHRDRMAPAGQLPGRGRAGQAGPDDDDVTVHR